MKKQHDEDLKEPQEDQVEEIKPEQIHGKRDEPKPATLHELMHGRDEDKTVPQVDSPMWKLIHGEN